MKYLLSFLMIHTLLLAQDSISIEDDFLQSLEEVSEIATKTKLNIDDSPSFITVLHSDKLKKLGITDVFEALALVPGVQLKKEASGVPIVVFRGVTQKGEVKLMVDGITLNNNYRGSIYHYLDFPIEMIKRIEVIRGAGSTLYGSGAISGVINIITNASQEEYKNDIFLSGETYNAYKGGGILSTDIGGFKLTLDGYYQEGKKEIEKSDRHHKNSSIGINLSDKNFSFLARLKKSDIGNAYGILGVPDYDKNIYNNENNSLLSQISYKNSLTQNNQIALFAGYTRYAQYAQAAHPSIALINAEYKESSFYSQIDLISNSLENNELLVGAKLESAETLESSWSAGPPYVSNPDFSRDTISLYLNDKYSISNSFDISAGLRYDDYSDFGDAFSPNFGLLYRVNKQIRLKALYSHAFRAPSWVELTSNPNLQAEKSDSIEAGFVFKRNQYHVLRVNFYASQINDMITKPEKTYVQNATNNFLGSEIEYVYAPNYDMEFNFIASYINAQDDDGNDLADIANILTSASLIYKLDSGVSFGSLLKYVSSSKRSITDTRDDMPDSLIFDQTVSYSYKNFTSSLIIKDLFDHGTFYALPQNSTETDFDDGGRSIILNVAMEF
ncbi:MAG: hypothetical protein DRG78_21835 [Epsilonproteobacteria bacterium]|nr:MAG: hypothetical protein DRG78_21835 [Campylobacterota bacterium]